MAGKYKIVPRDLSRDTVNQLNKIFDQIEQDILTAQTTANTAQTTANAATTSGTSNG